MKQRAKGAGSVGQKKDGTYYATLQHNGKRRWVSAKTEKEVLAKLRELRRQAQTGGFEETEAPAPKRAELTVEKFLYRWLEESVPNRNKARTERGYRQIVELHILPTIGKVPLRELRPEQVQSLLNGLSRQGKSPRTVRNVRAVLRRALNHALRWDYVERNVATLIDLPRMEPYRIEPLSLEEARVFLAHIKGHRLEVLYQLALTLGLRQGELLALQLNDLDLEQRTLRVAGTLLWSGGKLVRDTPKSAASYRVLPIPQLLLGPLRDHLQRQRDTFPNCDYLFASEVGTPISPPNLLRQFKSLLREAGLRKVRFHDLRHTAATMLVSAGYDARTVATILGHSQITTTLSYYAHSVSSQTRGAVDGLGGLLSK